MSRPGSDAGAGAARTFAPVIDAREFARGGQTVAGRLKVAELARFASMLSSSEGAVSFQVRGRVDRHGRGWLELACDTEIGLTCQRCLQPLQLPLAVRNTLRLLDAEPGWSVEEAEHAGQGEDEIVASSELDLLALIEDELLLALPLSPRHDSCEMAGDGGDVRRESPFGVLAELRKARKH